MIIILGLIIGILEVGCDLGIWLKSLYKIVGIVLGIKQDLDIICDPEIGF